MFVGLYLNCKPAILNPNNNSISSDDIVFELQLKNNDYGYIVFDYDGTRRVWKILDDGMESLVIRTSGSYDFGSSSSGETTTMYLTRVGP